MRIVVILCALLLAVPAVAIDRQGEGSSRLQPSPCAKRKRSKSRRASKARARGRGKTPPRSGDRKLSVAVLDIETLGLPSDMRESLVLLLRNTFNTMDSVKMISPVDIHMALEDPSNAQVARCEGGPACAVKLGRLVGADVVVHGAISGIGEAFSLTLRALDVKRNAEMGREKADISDRDSLIPQMRLAAYRLIAPDRITGALLVQIDIAGVEVELDGRPLGVTPFAEPVRDLVPGEHYVVLRRPGYSEFKQVLTIRVFETTRLQLQLGEKQEGERVGQEDPGEG